MTLSQALDYCRNRHNAGSDSNWSDAEIYAIMSAKCNEVLSVIGLIEATDTSIVSVASQAEYNFPTNFEFIKHVQFNGYPLRLIQFSEYEQEKTGNVMPTTNPPEYYVVWNQQLIIVPTPSTAALTIKVYGEKRHPFIDGTSQTTIDIPEILHYRMCDGVIADMFAKDLNANMYDRYETKWNKIHMPAFFQYKMLKKYRGKTPIIVDGDSASGTEHGVI